MTVEVVEFLQSLRSGFSDGFFQFVSFLGEEYFYIVLLSVIYFAINKKSGEFLGMTLFFTGIFNSVLKGLFSLPRPFEKYPELIENLRPETATGSSFPSGHTQNFTAFTIAGALNQKIKGLLYFAIIFSIMMGLSRMYLGAHFLEDVAVSFVLGLITAVVLYKVYSKIGNNDKTLMKINLGILLVFLPFLFFIHEDDLFKSYGMMIGFTIGIYVEKHYIKFTMNVSFWKKVLRVLLGLVIMVALKFGLSMVFDSLAEEGTTVMNMLDLIRYGLIVFVGLGLYPFLFKKFKF